MSQFSFEDYQKQQAARKAAAINSENGKKGDTAFINSFLSNDGDTVVVRFPYRSMSDITFESTHSVKFPKSKWNKRVRCQGENCPLCKNGVKTEFRFFVKALVYQVSEDGTMQVIPGIWDRAAAFADIDIKNKMQQCLDDDIGTLADNLVKIRKTGSGLETRYTLDIVAPTNKIYNSTTCPADFTLLEKIDAVKILTKSFDQYIEAINEDKPVELNSKEVNQPEIKQEPVQEQTLIQKMENAVQTNVSEEVQTPVQDDQPKRSVRFSF